MSPALDREVFRRSGLLGTFVDVTVIGAGGPEDAGHAAAACFEEIERLQRVFNVFDEQSELRRWQRGETAPGPELAAVTTLASRWTHLSGGAFDPAVDALVELWNAAAASREPPSDADIARLLAPRRMGETGRWSLNAIAKGWIVDRTADRALRAGLLPGLLINAGGDLLATGGGYRIVGIENPRRPYDNEPPVARVALRDVALATSGNTRRGWTIAGEWYGHVIDPRTGRPVGHVDSASVIAVDAATADAVATILTVLPVPDGLAFADRVGVGCLILDATGVAHRNHRWRHAEAAASANSQTRLSHLPG